MSRLGTAIAWAALSVVTIAGAAPPAFRTFATPEEAVQALAAAVKAGNLAEVIAIFAPDGQELADASDPATGQRNRQVFTTAFAEGWHLVSQGGNRKTLVIGNEDWPFPVPLVKQGSRWRFDTAAGKEEVIARRIGRNELAAIEVCHAFVAAQLRYAKDGHDGKPAGLFAATFRSDPGRQNGLYWPAVHGQPRSPLGDLVAEAAAGGAAASPTGEPTPLHGYYFKILTAQGAHAPGGAKSYLADGSQAGQAALSGGFALVAWPAIYDGSGVMTFIVDRTGAVRQKDLGASTGDIAKAMAAFDPDASWTIVR